MAFQSGPLGNTPQDISCFGGCEDWGCNPPRCAQPPGDWRKVNGLVQQICESISTYHNMFVVSGANACSQNKLFNDLKGCPKGFEKCDESPASMQMRLSAHLTELFCKCVRPGIDMNLFGLQVCGPVQPNPAWTSGIENIVNMLVRVACYVNYITCNLKEKIEEFDPRTRRTKVCLFYELCGRVKNRNVFHHFLDQDSCCGDDEGTEQCASFVVPVCVTATVSKKLIVDAKVMINHGDIIRQTNCAVPTATVFESVTVCKDPCGCCHDPCESDKNQKCRRGGGGCGTCDTEKPSTSSSAYGTGDDIFV